MKTPFQSVVLVIAVFAYGQRPAPGASRLASVAGSAFEEPLIATGISTPQEDEALYKSIEAFRAQTDLDDLRVFENFLASHPGSPWRVALLTNLGLAYYHAGYFSRAIAAWEQAWRAGREFTNPPVKALVDRAAGELARMHARLGHARELERLFREIGDRAITGPATESIQGAREALWLFHNEPGVSYLCGPMALRSLLLSQGAPYSKVDFLNKVRSGPQGVSIAEVARLAKQAQLPHRLIFRRPGQPIPVPSIVHWRVTHFAALVEEVDGRFHLQDPTFGSDLWVTRRALEAEASGYFLVPNETLVAGWRPVSEAEARRVRGMGNTTSNDPGATTPCDVKVHASDRGCGMSGYNVHEMVVSLNLNDTPVGYRPPRGPDVHVTITFNQREANQPANFAWFNVSPKWTLNWLSYIQDDPTNARATVMRYVAGGGSVSYPFVTASNSYTRETRDASLLVRTSTAPIAYERRLPDGSREVYTQSNGATTNPRRVFLTQIVDAQGNSVSLTYDSQMRLTAITDAVKRVTKFSYDQAGRPLLVTGITDPFGRSATLAYDSSGRLNQITDVIGLTSQFTYDDAGLVNSMTTPYGTTKFVYAQQDGILGLGTFRSVEITDPLGQKEKVEFRHYASQIFAGDPENQVPTGNIKLVDDYLWFRDTYYWDKHAWAVINSGAPATSGPYPRARAKHWLHMPVDQNVTARSVESIKQPSENRVWLNYPGQPNPILAGTLDKVTRIARVMDDGTTALAQVEYNTMGHVTRKIDAAGRETDFVYDPNQIDLLQVQQKTAGGLVTVATLTYNSQHLPVTYKDGAGQTTRFTYSVAGQLTQITDPINRVTRYEYDTLGYLTRVVNPNGQTAESRTYDPFGRRATRTDSEGYTRSYGYDALDRLTKIGFPDGTTHEYTWDKLDVVAMKDRQGRITQYTYDALRNLTTITDPIGRVTTFGYYENGRLKSITDANGNTTSWDIDLQNRTTARHQPDGTTLAYTYENTTSRLKSITDALGQIRQFSYTADGQIAGIDYLKTLNPTPSVHYTYDPNFRRVTSMTDGAGTTQYQYQPAGSPGAFKLAKVTGPAANATIAYEYDALGRMISRTVGTSTESFTYDTLGRVASHTNDLGTFDFTWLGETHQMASRALRGSALETDWSYDTNENSRRLTRISSSAGRGYQFTTTPENLITQIAETAAPDGGLPAHTWSYSYDEASQLLQSAAPDAGQFAYSYDAVGNILSDQTPGGAMNLGYNVQNQVTSANDRAFVYDANGNLTDDGLRTYTWDAENRLLNVTSKTQPDRTTTFRYDGTGRRIAAVSAGVETHYLWCGQKLCQARDAGDTVIRQYFPEGEISASGAVVYQRDHLGSVRDVFSAADGKRLASYDYDPFGNSLKTEGQAATDFRFAEMFYDQGSGLYLTRYRAYDPAAARWLSRDPLGQLGGLNLYAYAAPNPISNHDPSGASNLLDKGATWLGEKGAEQVAETGLNNFLGQYLPPEEAELVTAGSMEMLDKVVETRGEILYCPECMVAVFVEGAALAYLKEMGLDLLREGLGAAWQNYRNGGCPNIAPANIVSPWYLHPTVQDDTAEIPDGPLVDVYDWTPPPGASMNPDRPFIVYMLGPFGLEAQSTFLLGGPR